MKVSTPFDTVKKLDNGLPTYSPTPKPPELVRIRKLDAAPEALSLKPKISPDTTPPPFSISVNEKSKMSVAFADETHALNNNAQVNFIIFILNIPNYYFKLHQKWVVYP
jgi:hypothetical protein